MRYLILFFFILLTSLSSKAQKELNLGEVRYDSLFSCHDSLRRGLNERLYNIQPICDSKNDIEIRLNGFAHRQGKNEFIILSYKDGKWEAKKYTNGRGSFARKLTIISLPSWPYDSAMVDISFRYILNHLIENKIFLIQDQSKSISDEFMGHGIYLTISYKTQGLLRKYSFLHPDYYFQAHPGSDNKEYLYLKEILKTLEEMFNDM